MTDQISLPLPIPDEHPCFVDHFPGNPIVPGALLVSWISQKIEKHCSIKLNQISSVKFILPVFPGIETLIVVDDIDVKKVKLKLMIENQVGLVAVFNIAHGITQ